MDNAWQARLLPEGQLLRRKSDGFVGFVLRAYTVAALCWPARPLELNLWVEDLEVEELAWVVCFAIEGFEVLPSEWSSPLHLILEDIIKSSSVGGSRRTSIRNGSPSSHRRRRVYSHEHRCQS